MVQKCHRRVPSFVVSVPEWCNGRKWGTCHVSRKVMSAFVIVCRIDWMPRRISFCRRFVHQQSTSVRAIHMDWLIRRSECGLRLGRSTNHVVRSEEHTSELQSPV